MALPANADTQAPADAELKPMEPIEAIIDALESHDIVALDEGRHRTEQAHQLRLTLIRHMSFARHVNDIVVEFGNARYQDVMDRYVRGEMDFAAFMPPEEARFAIVDGRPSPLPRDRFRVLPMQEQFDAPLYLGPLSTIREAKLPASLCADAGYRQMRRSRLLLLNQKAQGDQFDRECGGSPSAK